MTKMALELDYSLNEKVWIIHPKTVKRVTSITCTGCKGSGKTKLKDNKTYDCPKCQGLGVEKDLTYDKVPLSGTINRIEIRENPYCLANGEKEISINYGITNKKAKGCHNKSGFYTTHRVFKTKKACQEHIDHGEG